MVMQVSARLTKTQFELLRRELRQRWPAFGSTLQATNDWPVGRVRFAAVRGGTFPADLTIDSVKRLIDSLADLRDDGRLSPLWADRNMQRVALRNR